MLRLPLLAAASPIFLATAALADQDIPSRDVLVQTLIEAGSHAHDDERHAVEVDECTMVTYRWRNRPNHGWVLWSSFRFPMAQARFVESKGPDGTLRLYAATDFAPDSGQDNLVVFSWKMRDGSYARFEKSNLRKRPEEARNSPRNDGTTHFYLDVDYVNFIHIGPNAGRTAQTFTSAFETYVRHYCTFTG